MCFFPALSEPARAGHRGPGHRHSVAGSSRSPGRERAVAALRSREPQRSDPAPEARPGFFEPSIAQGERGVPPPPPPRRPRPILVYPVGSSPPSRIRARPAPSCPVPLLLRCAPPRLALSTRSCPFLSVPVRSCPFLPRPARFCPVLPRTGSAPPHSVLFLYRPCTTFSRLATPCPILPGPALAFPITPCPVLSHPALFCPVRPSPAPFCFAQDFGSQEPPQLWVVHSLAPGRQRWEED